jgi:uncharacterized membrane protein (UPF0127 family)
MRYQLQVADTAAERSKGLGGLSVLSQDTGMLFVYDYPSKECFWMKDMRFALDIIWLNTRKQVVYMAQRVAPETYPETYCPDTPARYVIELPAGAAARGGVHTGDTLSF